MNDPKKCRGWFRLGPLLALCAGVAAGCGLLASAAHGQQEKGAGITMAGDAEEKDVGLPLYPGSRRHKDEEKESPGVNLGLWGGGSGFKLAVLKMESDDSMEKIAEFYKKKLQKFGKVLDCSHATGDAEKEQNAKQLTCEDDKPEKGGLLFKAGTKSDQHIVAIQPAAHGSLYQLVHVAHWGDEEKK